MDRICDTLTTISFGKHIYRKQIYNERLANKQAASHIDAYNYQKY